MRGEFRWLLVLVAGAVAIILFVVLRPEGNDEETATTTATVARRTTAATTTERTTTAAASGVDIAVTIEDGKPVGGIAKATVKQGEKVALVVHSDVADEVHLHGYDLHSDVEAGGTATISFTASIAGRFEAELEDRQEQILSLTVEP